MVTSSSETILSLQQRALSILHEDADKIVKLIQVQMETLTNRRCPLYEEVLDTQMYGFSRAVDFAIRSGLVEESEGKAILSQLERKLAELYEALDAMAKEE